MATERRRRVVKSLSPKSLKFCLSTLLCDILSLRGLGLVSAIGLCYTHTRVISLKDVSNIYHVHVEVLK